MSRSFKKFPAAAALLALCLAAEAAESGSAVLKVMPVPESMTTLLPRRFGETVESENSRAVIILGAVSGGGLAFRDVKDLLLTDADGSPVSLCADLSSVKSEFGGGEMNSLTICFAMTREDLEKGPPVLSWGQDISRGMNFAAPNFDYDPPDRRGIKTFISEFMPAAKDSGGTPSATSGASVESSRWIWYLTPAVLLLSLALRRLFAK
jgi:hypothetical protein